MHFMKTASPDEQNQKQSESKKTIYQRVCHFFLCHRFTLVSLLLILFFLGCSFFFLLYGTTWLDEAGYMYDTWLIQQGETPYQDFWVKTTPLMYHVYGWVQDYVGFNLYTGRAISFVFLGLLLLSLYALAKKLKIGSDAGAGEAEARWAGLLAVSFIITNMFLMHYYITATPYAMTALCLILPFLILMSSWHPLTKTILASLVFSLAFLTRVNALPLLVFFPFFFLLFYKKRYFFISLGTILLTSFLGLLPFLLSDMKATLFDVFGTSVSLFFPSFDALRLNTGSSTLFGSFYFFFQLLHLNFLQFFFLFIIVLFGALWFLQRKRTMAKEDILQNIKQHAVFYTICFFLLISLPFLFLSFVTKIYWVFCAPFLAIILSFILIKVWGYLKEPIKTGLVCFIIVGLLLSPTIFDLGDFSHPLKESDLERMDRIGGVLQKEIDPQDKVMIFGNVLHQLYAAQRKTYPALTHRQYLFKATTPTHVVERYHYFNYELLTAWFNEADVVLISADRTFLLHYAHKMPGVVQEQLDQNGFTLVMELEQAFPGRYLKQGPLQIYKKYKKQEQPKPEDQEQTDGAGTLKKIKLKK